MKLKLQDVWSADFETTTEANLKRDGYVRVWLWSFVRCDLTLKLHGNDMFSFLDTVKRSEAKRVFFYNLRFDGSFIVDWLLRQGYEYGKHFDTVIDGMNIWYSIRIYWSEDHKIYTEFYDGLKKFPGMSLNDVAELYDIPKKTMEGETKLENFAMYRPEDYQPTKEEIEYCVHDSEIQAIAIASEMQNNHVGMTLSSDAFKDVRGKLCRYMDPKHGYPLAWRKLLPVISPEDDAWMRDSYKGGWVYVNPEHEGKELHDVTVLDVNSLYPSVMYNALLPVGHPYRSAVKPPKGTLYIIQVDCIWSLKRGKLPTLQIKGDPLYDPTEYLEHDKGVTELIMTSYDWDLFCEHYDVTMFSVPRYVCFRGRVGILRPYIDYWMDVKKKAAHGSSERFISKRYLNSPYGKAKASRMGMRQDRINKVPELIDGEVHFINTEETTEGVYLPYATFVAAAARCITIRAAQKCYDEKIVVDGEECGRFVYADTDSIHIIGDPPKNLWIDDRELGAWKMEGRFPIAKYLRPKTYIHCNSDYSVYTEKLEHKDGTYEMVPEGLKCAGMPDNIKRSLTFKVKEDDPCPKRLLKTYAWDNFFIGNKFEGKKSQFRVPGGLIIRETTYELKEQTIRTGLL